MTEQKIKKLWQEQPDPVQLDRELLYRSLQKQLHKTHTKIVGRDILEITAALFIILFSIYHLFSIPSLLSKTGFILMGVQSVFIIVKLLLTGRKKKPAHLLTTYDQAQEEYNYLLSQKKLLQSVWLWYLLPYFAAVILIVAGAAASFAISLGIILFTALLYGVIFILNRHTALHKIQPLIDRLDQVLQDSQPADKTD